MKFGIIKERKIPQDRRVVFSPTELHSLKTTYPTAVVQVESSDIRVFSDQQYTDLGIDIATNMQDCEVLFGVKEVPVDALIPNKKYFFFSHTIKKQAYNRKLLLAVLEKNIELYDHETIVDEKFNRLIGFGRYAGIVGSYNAFKAFGLKFELFTLPKVETLLDKDALIAKLKRQTLPPIKIVLTGFGKVGMGAKEVLDGVKIKQVSVENFLTKNYSEAVYTHIDVLDYYKRIDGLPAVKEDLYNNPKLFTTDFERFANCADILITGHFYGTGAPNILTQDMLKSNNSKLKVVADISCDVNGPIACTLRASTIADPIYGYNPTTNTEINYTHPAAIVVMAVDNLPCELPKDASQGFGQSFMQHVIPAFFNNDKDGILARAKVTENGKLTERFSYLQEFVDGQGI